MELTLYYSPGACSQGAHIALREAGAIFALKEVAVHRGETQQPAFLKINPRGRVPALRVGTSVLTENVAILSFVARQYPDAELLPPDALDAARCLSFMARIASSVHPAFAHVVRPHRFAEGKTAQADVKETGARSYWAFIQEIDALIGSGPWVMGERYSLCDANLLPFWGFARRIRLPMLEVPNFTRWKDRMLQRPNVIEALQHEDSVLLRQREDS